MGLFLILILKLKLQIYVNLWLHLVELLEFLIQCRPNASSISFKFECVTYLNIWFFERDYNVIHRLVPDQHWVTLNIYIWVEVCKQ